MEMTSRRQDLDPKVIQWASNTLALPSPFQDAYMANGSAAAAAARHRMEHRRQQVQLTLEAQGLSSLACFSKKELRLLYDGLSGFIPTVQTHYPLKRSALKGQIVQHLGTLLTDPTIIQTIQNRPTTSPPQGNGQGRGHGAASAPSLPTSTLVPTSTSTPTMPHQPYYQPYPSFLSSPFAMNMNTSMLPSMPPPPPTLHGRQPMSAQTPLHQQQPLSPASASRKRKSPSPLSSSLPTPIPPFHNAFSLPLNQTTYANLLSSTTGTHNTTTLPSFTGPQHPPPPAHASLANPRSSIDRDHDEDEDDEDNDDDDQSLNSTDDTSEDDPTDRHWIQQLQACGFQDERELRHVVRIARRRRQQQQQQQQQGEDDNRPITLEGLICDIINAREDAALARDMDEARRQSEVEHQQELERLQSQRAEETEQRLLNATLQDWLHPPCRQYNNIFFSRSWLLRHPPLQSLLEDITLHHMDVKKELIALLQLEKNACRWYANGIAKSYYTHHLTKVLVDLDISQMATKLQEICQQINEGHALLSKQNSSGIPLLYIRAQEEYPTSEKDMVDKQNHHPDNGIDNGNDDDDEVQILDDEQIQKLKEKILSPQPTAPIEVDVDANVDEDH